MRYSLDIDLPTKPAIAPLNLKLAEPVVREFKAVAKETGYPMSRIITKLMNDFVIEHRSKGVAKQNNFNY